MSGTSGRYGLRPYREFPRCVAQNFLFKFIYLQFLGILFLCDHKLQNYVIYFCFTPNKASQSLSFFTLSDLHRQMRYIAPRKGKPFGLMPPSWDSFQTSSQEDDKREAQGLSPRKREISYASYDEDYQPYMNPTPCAWKQPYMAMGNSRRRGRSQEAAREGAR
jgi:hypothetical protein